MTGDSPSYGELDNLIKSYFHQDMEDFSPTVPDAIADYVRTSRPVDITNILHDIDDFATRYHDNFEVEFRRRWASDYDPSDYGEQSVGEFFDMVRGIIADPDSSEWYNDEIVRRHNEKCFPKLASIMVEDGHPPSPMSTASRVSTLQQSDKDQLLHELHDFERQFDERLDEAFEARSNCNNAKRFLNMIRAIISNLGCYIQFE